MLRDIISIGKKIGEGFYQALKGPLTKIYNSLPENWTKSLGKLGAEISGSAIGGTIAAILTDPTEVLVEKVTAFHKDAVGLLAKIAGVENPIHGL